MRAMILAAGKGSRMGELTMQMPKCLLQVKGRPLIEHLILNLKSAGITDIVINLHYLGEMIKNQLQDGRQFGLRILYSEERELLDVGGGIVNALPVLGSKPFIVVSGDIFTNYPFANLKLSTAMRAHLVMVKNPDFHLQGDFGLKENRIALTGSPTYTFANIGLYDPKLFLNYLPEPIAWRSILQPAIATEQVTGEVFAGTWYNVGTPIELLRAQTCTD